MHEGQEEQTSFVRQDLGGCLLVVVLQDESAKPILNFFIEVVLLGWRGWKLFWIHGSWPIPWAFLSLKVTCVFLTVAALRIN